VANIKAQPFACNTARRNTERIERKEASMMRAWEGGKVERQPETENSFKAEKSNKHMARKSDVFMRKR
jgi:hypothetical protein